MWEKATLVFPCWWEYKVVKALWKSVERFLKKLKIELPYDPVVVLWGTYLKECKSTDNQDTYTPMFTAALFTIAKIWN
jgi:hypothetical protein